VGEGQNSRRIEFREAYDLATAERPAGQMGGPELEPVEELPEVLRQRVRIIRRLALGASVTSARIGEHPMAIGEPRREVVIAMRRIPETMEEDHRLARPAPVQIMKTDSVDNREMACVRGWIAPRRSSCRPRLLV